MGFGDALMASSLGRGMHAQGKLIAFYSPDGDHRKIKWTGYCDDVFLHNPNIARPGQEKQSNITWFPHYKKQFPYCHYDGKKRRYIWHTDFKAKPGEFFFTEDEKQLPIATPFIVIEPNIAWQRQVNLNKDWGDGRYEKLATALRQAGHTIVQFIHGNSRRRLVDAVKIPMRTFHEAAAIMAHARLIIAPEGANHHAAAALGIPSVIVWGAWSPTTMGYDNQIKLTGKEILGCGNIDNCPHCRRAFDSISVDDVYQAAMKVLA